MALEICVRFCDPPRQPLFLAGVSSVLTSRNLQIQKREGQNDDKQNTGGRGCDAEFIVAKTTLIDKADNRVQAAGGGAGKPAQRVHLGKPLHPVNPAHDNQDREGAAHLRERDIEMGVPAVAAVHVGRLVVLLGNRLQIGQEMMTLKPMDRQMLKSTAPTRADIPFSSQETGSAPNQAKR